MVLKYRKHGTRYQISALSRFTICVHSKNIVSGCLFFAIKGLQHDGECYISDAFKKKVSYVVVNKNHKAQFPLNQYIFVDNVRAFFSKVLGYKYPNVIDYIVAVTGTNGKTSVSHFFQKLCNSCGFKSVSIGTLGIQSQSQKYIHSLHHHTTMPAVKLHKLFKYLTRVQYTHIVVESSSHGIAQYRINDVSFRAAVFTNLTQDHLDYHKNSEEYFQSKSRLFTEILCANSIAIINVDCIAGERLTYLCKKKCLKILDYGIKATHLKIISFVTKKVSLFNKIYELNVSIQGDFQLYNILAAIALAYSCGIHMNSLLKTLYNIYAPEGRLEYIGSYNKASIYIDYAHTPDSLYKILKIVKKMCRGLLHVVFGCGGDREKNKRYLMGKIANRLADDVYVTDDNPRTEDALIIRKRILDHCKKGLNIGNRKLAIKFAMNKIKCNDIFLVLGKGHENYQIIGKNHFPFSDHIEVEKYLYQ